MNIESLIQKFYEVRDQSQHLHQNTFSYAEHEALDKFYNEIVDLTDEFIENYFGKYRRINQSFNLTIKPYVDGFSFEYLTKFQALLKTDARIEIKNDTELNNILDEILALTNRTLYLLTLK